MRWAAIPMGSLSTGPLKNLVTEAIQDRIPLVLFGHVLFDSHVRHVIPVSR